MKKIIRYIATSMMIMSTFVGCTYQARQPDTEANAAVEQPQSTEDSIKRNDIAVDNKTVALNKGRNFSNASVGQLIGNGHVATTTSAVITADNVSLFIDSGAVSRDVDISIVATTEEHSGDIPDHITNLTTDRAVYRMLPDGQQFNRDITIAMGYDSTALPYGYTVDDIYTFFYNEETHLWQQVERDSVDTQRQIVYSRTNHFTDYINGVLKMPESSDAMAYTPTSIKDLKAADPMEGITLIAPPTANNQGTANLSYPLVIPSGRHGMQPSLSVTYNSAGGSGTLGLGWSLPISEISVETRWGVPLYDHQYETEAYTLDGTTLVTAYFDENNNLRLSKPVYHRAYEPRNSSDTLRFYPRVEGSFRKIERIGTSPDNYFWVVTDKNGTRNFYGQTTQSRLTDPHNNIARWMLEKSVDTYGNMVTYTYTTKYVSLPGQPTARQLCIDRIRYTGIDGTHDRGQYIIRFKYADKHDKFNSFRLGLEEINNYILDCIEVMFRDSIVREYYFGYREGEFGKTLLCNIVEGYDDDTRNQQYMKVPHSGERTTIRDASPYDRCDLKCYEKNIYFHLFHSFDYYGMDSDDLFASAVPMVHEGSGNVKLFDFLDSILYEKRNFGGSGSFGWNVYGAINVGTDYLTWLKTVSAGGHYSYSEDHAEGFLQLVDINGDGYPDKLYKSINGDLKYRPQIPGQNKFGAPISISGINKFQYTSSSTHNYGWEASAAIIGTGKSWSDGRSNTSVYVSDINGDGLVDIVDNGSVYVNRGGGCFADVTDNDTIHVGGTCDGNVMEFSGEVDATIFDDGYYTVEHVVCKTQQSEIPILDTVYNADGKYAVIQKGWQMGQPNDTCWTVVDTFYYTYPRRYEPNIDLVRMWKAPFSGQVIITGTAKLTDTLNVYRAATRTVDGVWASVQVAGETAPRTAQTILPNSTRNLSCIIDITAGDTLFFRINAVDKRLYDQVEWNPRIEYLFASHRNNVPAYPLSKIDANGYSMYNFDYATDYLLTENQSVTVGSESGATCYNSFSVRCKIKAIRPLSQDMVYSLVKVNIDNTGIEQTIKSTVFSHASSPDTSITWTASNIPSNKKLILRLSPVSDGQLKWSDIETDATVTMTYSSDATINACLSDSNASKAYVYHPAVNRRFYDYLVFPSTTITGVGGSPVIRLSADRTDGTPFDGELYMTVKDYQHNVCFGKNIVFSNGISVIPTFPFVFPYNSATQYSVDCYTTDTTSAATISRIKVRFNGSTQYDAGLYAKYGKDEDKHHGTLYRGWGQFGYKSPDSTSLYINSNLIHAESYYTDPSSVPHITDLNIDSIDVADLDPDSSPEETGYNIFNPLAGSFFEMHADAGKARWSSFANLVTASRSISSLDNTDPATENGQPATVNMFQNPLPVVVPGTKMKAVNKMVLNKGNGSTKKKNAHNVGYSRLLGDFMDLNGDRFPDNVSEKVIQYSRAQGGLSNIVRGYSYGDGINRTDNSSAGKANNGTFLNIIMENVSNAKESRVVSTVSGLFQLLRDSNDSTLSADVTQNTFMDINGDGLADIVFSNGTVRYNMGYSFSNPRIIPTATIRASRSVAYAKGYGFNVANTSITGSIGRNKADNRTTSVLMDVNADGLPDMVSQSQIRINMGDGSFANYSSVGMDNSSSTSFSLNVTGTYDAVFSIFGFPLKVGGSAGGGATASFSHSNAEFTDMDNDGYVDYVYRDGNNIKVRYSNIGKSNLLRSVTNFAKAKLQIGYEMSAATVDCPQRHWNMTSLAIYDGHDGDGSDTIYKRYAYGSRHYDRFERDDYGYDSVNTYDYISQVAFNSNVIYRTFTQHFRNDDWYHAHLKTRDSVYQGTRYVVTKYTYADADILDGHYLGDSTPAWCKGDGWPALASEETRNSEGAGSIVATKRDYYYGQYGNVTGVNDYGDITDTTDNYDVTLGYALDPSRYIVANVEYIDIPGYRHRKASYTAEGSLDQILIDNSPNPLSVYSYKYDSYGNVAYVRTPAVELSSGDPYYIDYKYDPLLHMLPIEVSNAEGHTSTAVYSYRWQKPILTRDIGGNTMRYSYDNHSRIDRITAPKEITFNIPYTVKYDYWYSRLYGNPLYTYTDSTHGLPYYCWARTRNYDPSHPGNDINTVIFSDGLARIIQLKKDVDVSGLEVRAVGGTVHYDGLGRKQKEFFLQQETDLQVFDTLLNNYAALWQVQYAYDFLNRVVRTDYADGTSTSNVYTIATDVNNINRFCNAVTDQNMHTSLVFTDPRQLNIQLTDALNHTTLFLYDAIGQLSSSIDPEGNATTHKYDLGGRRTKRKHPSAGLIHWDYDAAGNMTKLTQNSGELIIYTYNYSRLMQIAYPNRPWNNVWYKYGPPSYGSQAGRLVQQQDASGVQEFKYDDMGNMVYNRHTYVQPGSPNTLTLTTMWSYDSWGRVLKIIYPDNEVVVYSYNHGGNVSKIEGIKTGNSMFAYIDSIGYDLYEQRVYQKDGNGVETFYQYNPYNRQLDRLYDFSTQTSQLLQDNSYKYDNVGNIIGIKDNGLNPRSQGFEYDNINRLTQSYGSWRNDMLTYESDYTYSSAGRMLKKNVTSLRMNTMGIYPMDYQNTYSYASSGNPFAVQSVQDAITSSTNSFEWDANGNMVHSVCNAPYYERHLCWTEDNRLQGYSEYSEEQGDISAWYNYAAGGDRNFKITSPKLNLRQNAEGLRYSAYLKYPTLYASALITFNKGGYTKHYFEGSNRICSRIGGGFSAVSWSSIENRVPELDGDYESLFNKQNESVNHTFDKCLGIGIEADDIIDLYDVVKNEHERDEQEPAFFYHSDHLGSAAYLTNDAGQVTQTLNYLPYGEDWVDVQNYVETRYPRLGIYTFNGKEKDYESGFHYYGARYYWSEVLTGWLSVDPLMDKYPSVSPYNYCILNPVIFVDPDGMEGIVVSGSPGNHNNTNHFLENGLSRAKEAQKKLKDKKHEKVTWIVYNDPKNRRYTKKQLEAYKKKAKKAGIQLNVVENVDEIVDYINNKKNGSRKDDKISCFYYVGHATPGDLDVGYAGSGENFDPNDLKSSAFREGAYIDVVGGCRTAKGCLLEKSVVNQFRDILDKKSTIKGSDVRVHYPGGVVDNQTLVKPNKGTIVEKHGKL